MVKLQAPQHGEILAGRSTTDCIIFMSDNYAGRMSDEKLPENSVFLDKLKPNDVVLADRYFFNFKRTWTSRCHFGNSKVHQRIKQLLYKDVEAISELSNARIHVERSIGRLQVLHIFPKILRINILDEIEKFFVLCAALLNLQPKLVSWVCI